MASLHRLFRGIGAFPTSSSSSSTSPFPSLSLSTSLSKSFHSLSLFSKYSLSSLSSSSSPLSSSLSPSLSLPSHSSSPSSSPSLPSFPHRSFSASAATAIPMGDRLQIPILVIDQKGKQHAINAYDGYTLLECLDMNHIEILADCGGGSLGETRYAYSGVCRTCHVYIDNGHFHECTALGEPERERLYWIDDLTDNSRLACEIIMKPALANMTVIVAPLDRADEDTAVEYGITPLDPSYDREANDFNPKRGRPEDTDEDWRDTAPGEVWYYPQVPE